jgi:hypothetical protein
VFLAFYENFLYFVFHRYGIVMSFAVVDGIFSADNEVWLIILANRNQGSIVIFCFFLIMYLGPYLPGIWAHSGLSFTEILDATVWTRLQGIWDVPLRMSASFIILFFIFGKYAKIEVGRGAKPLDERPALLILGPVQNGHWDVLHIEGNGVTEKEHQQNLLKDIGCRIRWVSDLGEMGGGFRVFSFQRTSRCFSGQDS